MRFKVEGLDAQQGSEEWLKGRSNYLGGSEISSVLGKSPWKTADILFLEKTGKHIEDNSSKQWLFDKGHQKEIVGRDAYSLIVLKKFEPAVYRNTKFPWAQVSLDGVSDDMEVLELKYQGTEDFINLSFNNTIPDKYIPQLQYICGVMEIPQITFIGVSETNEIAYRYYKADVDYITNMMLKAEMFWERVKNGT